MTDRSVQLVQSSRTSNGKLPSKELGYHDEVEVELAGGCTLATGHGHLDGSSQTGTHFKGWRDLLLASGCRTTCWHILVYTFLGQGKLRLLRQLL